MTLTLSEIQAQTYRPASELCRKYGLGKYLSTAYLVAIEDSYRNSVLPTDAALTMILRASSRSVIQTQMRVLQELGLVEVIARTTSSGNVWNLTKLGKACVKDVRAIEKSFRQRKS